MVNKAAESWERERNIYAGRAEDAEARVILLEKRIDRLRLVAVIAKHCLPARSRRGVNQRDLAAAIKTCEDAGDLDGGFR